MKLKTIVILATAAALSTPAYAGGMAEPMMEPEVLVAETAAGSGGIVLPLLLLAVIAAAASSGGGSDAPVAF